MIIPLRHESNHGRRWPHVTIALIALNALLFIVTHGALEQEFTELAQVQSRTVRLAAERAAAEYEKLAEAYPAERAAVLALISAARIHLRLGNLPQAGKLYAAAQVSPVPHRDWDETIRKGLEKATGGGQPKAVEVSGSSLQR